MIDLPTTCGFCSCGCALYVEPGNGTIGALCPSAHHPVSTGRLCIKGWNATPSLLGANRLKTPLIRKGDELRPASWDEAISFAADALRRTVSESGPDGVGFIGSAKTTNEECYSLVKLARAVVGAPNVDGACRFYDASILPGLLSTVGAPASQVELSSLAGAGSMLIVGANVMEQLAHVGSRIQDAAENGCKIVAADPRVSRIAPQASVFLHPLPGTDLIWLRALIHTIIGKKLYVDRAPELPGFEELRASLDGLEMARLQQMCGVDSAQIAEVAELLAGNGPGVVMFGLGVLQQRGSTQIVRALADVAILLGGSVMPLRGQNNAQGACDMGLTHDYLPGYAAVSDVNARKKWESAWGCTLPSKPGASAVDMLRGCAEGAIKSLMVFGENVALSAPQSDRSAEALNKVEFLAVADLYLTETAQLADVVFPACSFLEKDGTFTSIERRVQRVRKVIEPVGESRSDLDIIAALASSMGGALSADPAEVMSEIAANVPGYETVSYAAMDESWAERLPCDDQTPALAPIPEASVETTADFPLRLVASRINFHQQTGTMSMRSSVLAREYPEAFAEMNETDAERLGLRPGRKIRISSKLGSLTRTLLPSDAVREGCLHVPHFFGGDSPNALASYECDPESGVPIYKGCAVRVEAVE